MAARSQSAWSRRLKLLKAVCLDRVADEINAVRLVKLQQKAAAAAAGPAAVRKKYRRIVRLWEAGELTELPSDMRADAGRMKRLLIALHLAIGERPCITRTVDGIAALLEELTESTARRGVLDLDAGYLVRVKRQERARRAGGQGPSEYAIVWSTITDLALSQGQQQELFEAAESAAEHLAPGGTEGAADSVGAETHRPDESSGQNRPPGPDVCGRAPSHGGRAPSHGGRAPSHGGRAPSHGGRAPSHGGRAYKTARGNLSYGSRISPTEVKPASSEAAGDFRVVGRSGTRLRPEKQKPDEILLWQEVGRRLASYGLGATRMVADPNRGRGSAGENGWSVHDVLAFMTDVERETIDGEQKWEPGAVWFQLVKCAAGSRITGMRPREAWVRAQRDRDLRMAGERKAREDAAIAEGRTIDAAKVAAWELRLTKHHAAQEARRSPGAGGGDGDPPRPGSGCDDPD